MELGSTWNSVPHGTRFQMELGSTWNPISDGTRFHMEPDFRWNPIPHGTRFQWNWRLVKLKEEKKRYDCMQIRTAASCLLSRHLTTRPCNRCQLTYENATYAAKQHEPVPELVTSSKTSFAAKKDSCAWNIPRGRK